MIQKYAFYYLYIALKFCCVIIVQQNKLVFYRCNADIPAQKFLKLILEDNSLNWCTTVSQVRLVLFYSNSDSLIMQVNVRVNVQW